MRTCHTTLSVTQKTYFKTSVLLPAFLLMLHSVAVAGDGIEWDRFRLTPALTISETYNSNIYREAQNETDDLITAIIPDLSLDIAVVPRNYISLKYRGEFLAYADTSNFREDHHLGSLSFNSETPKGSHLIVGVSAEDTAINPDSSLEESEDYTLQSTYADVLLMLGEVTEVSLDYVYSERDFDELQNADDEFTRKSFDLSALYKYSEIIPFLLQYRYVNQDNNDTGVSNTDFESHTVFIGGRWRPEMRLSGVLRVGYTWAEFDEAGGEDYSGYAIDTDLIYNFSDITRFVLGVERVLRQRTVSENDSGDYYVNTLAEITLVHRRWERITTRANIFYQNREFNEIQGDVTVRKDDMYGVGLSIEWLMREWVSFSLAYRFRTNDSDVAVEDYDENQVTLGVTLSM